MQNHKSPKPVLITGASSGIGYCIAMELQKLPDYQVLATARKLEDVERLRKSGLWVAQLDLSQTESINHALEQILLQSEGRLFALINNAAYGQPGAVEDLSRAALREQFEVNVFGTQELTNQLIPVMRKQGYGRIIQISSLLGYVALKYRGAYTASKFALEALSDTLRMELQGSGIEVVIIEPGPIATHFRNNAMLAYQRNIAPSNSAHHAIYKTLEERLLKEGPAMPFTLPPEAVYAKVLCALHSKRPKTRYLVTFPSYLFKLMKRFLPDRMLDFFLSKI